MKKIFLVLIIILIIFLLFILIFPKSYLNEPLNKIVAGIPDKDCNLDSDCIYLKTTCSYCDCGEAINKNWKPFCPFEYVRCDMACLPPKVKCIENKCQVLIEKK